MIRVVIADDHHLVRQGIRALLEESADITVIGEAGDGQKTLELAKNMSPDVLVLDIGMPQLSGIQVVEKMSQQQLETRVVILSMHTDQRIVKHALQAGARVYVVKVNWTDEV